MKKIIKNPIFTFVLGALIFGGIVGVSAYTIFANDVGYTPKDSTWKKSNGEDITNVKDAIDELYTKANSSSPLLNKICTYQSEGSYGQKGQVGALYDCEVGTNIHKNFYILTVRNKDVELIMDRNVNNETVSWNDAYNYFDNNSNGILIRNQWNNVLNVTLPSAQAIANAVGNENWKVQDHQNWWCLETKIKDTSSHCINNTNVTSWLWNNLQNCSNYNCDINGDSNVPLGYWTRDTLRHDGTLGWTIETQGRLNNGPSDSNSSSGIRPVITLLKSQLN